MFLTAPIVWLQAWASPGLTLFAPAASVLMDRAAALARRDA